MNLTITLGFEDTKDPLTKRSDGREVGGFFYDISSAAIKKMRGPQDVASRPMVGGGAPQLGQVIDSQSVLMPVFFYGVTASSDFPGALVVLQKIGIDSNQHEQTPNANGKTLVWDVPLNLKSFLRDEVRDVAGDGERCGILGLTTKKKSPTLVNRA